MPWNKNLDRTGKMLTYTQRVAQTMNWYGRCMKGLIGQLRFSTGYFIMSSDEYSTMSTSRKRCLQEINVEKQKAILACEKVEELIIEFSTLPITISDEETGRLPRSYMRKQKVHLKEPFAL